ncbi:unnamed protein product [Adineta ricciae]|uniref:Uncharacterized protein n=1 Tax=Adineta ricciae TaxID=249248 RepID=A0A814KYT4_ADIRI|nr:unnamed protein product [Adineta ricciae]
MPKYNFMVSRAVDLVARKLAGMDTETVARLTQVLSEEAQSISDELQYSGQNVDADVLAARLEGLVARIKHEARNTDHDPSPHEFPIFNVSHNPSAPYPNPINHLYDKRYKEAYSTFIKQNQQQSSASSATTAASTSSSSTSQTPKSSTPSVPSPATSSTTVAIKPSSSSTNPNYSKVQYQRQSSNQLPSPGFVPAFTSQNTSGWPYTSPYLVMTNSNGDYYSSQGSNNAQPSSSNAQVVHRSATGTDLQSSALSRSVSTNNLSQSSATGKEQIRVRVINDSSNPSGLLRRSNSAMNVNNDALTTPTIYASPSTELDKETMEDLFKVVNSQRAEARRSTASPMRERIIVIDRRGSATPDNGGNPSGQNRFRTYEIRTPGLEKPSSSSTGTTPTSPSTTTVAVPSTTYTSQPQQTNYFPGQQVYYQQPKMYSSTPTNPFSTSTPYASRVNGFYPYGYYHY